MTYKTTINNVYGICNAIEMVAIELYKTVKIGGTGIVRFIPRQISIVVKNILYSIPINKYSYIKDDR